VARYAIFFHYGFPANNRDKVHACCGSSSRDPASGTRAGGFSFRTGMQAGSQSGVALNDSAIAVLTDHRNCGEIVSGFFSMPDPASNPTKK